MRHYSKLQSDICLHILNHNVHNVLAIWTLATWTVSSWPFSAPQWAGRVNCQNYESKGSYWRKQSGLFFSVIISSFHLIVLVCILFCISNWVYMWMSCSHVFRLLPRRPGPTSTPSTLTRLGHFAPEAHFALEAVTLCSNNSFLSSAFSMAHPTKLKMLSKINFILFHTY